MEEARGCGVIEDAQSGDLGIGNLEHSCQPPKASWLMSLSGGDEQERLTQQHCDRLTQHQSAQYALSILKEGWLWRRAVSGGWRQRYFVFESGDQVRSAVLRYFTTAPSATNFTLEDSKSIILWDAAHLKAKPADVFKSFTTSFDADFCFTFYHFYRNYHFCVPVKGPGRAQEEKKERDEWMQLIEHAIVHRQPAMSRSMMSKFGR